MRRVPRYIVLMRAYQMVGSRYATTQQLIDAGGGAWKGTQRLMMRLARAYPNLVEMQGFGRTRTFRFTHVCITLLGGVPSRLEEDQTNAGQ